MLAKKQRDTFFFFLDTISKVLKENQDAAKLDDLEKDMIWFRHFWKEIFLLASK